MEHGWSDALQDILNLLEGSSIVDFELVEGDFHVTLKRGAGATAPRPEPAEAASAGDDLAYVVAPLLGTFYRAPSPGAEPFVHEGDLVEKGQVIGLIEAMKIFNEIVAEVSGRVHSILAEDGAFVEADERLIAIDTRISEERTV